MELNTILGLLSLFIIICVTNIMGTLKTILMSKNIMNPVYILVFIDAAIFALVLSKIANNTGFHYTIAFALGKTLGVYLGGKIEEKMALGIIEVDLFFSNKEKVITIADSLRTMGYTVNSYLARGKNGDRRHKIEVVMERKEYSVLENLLLENEIEEPTMKIKSLSKVNGKISTSSVN